MTDIPHIDINAHMTEILDHAVLCGASDIFFSNGTPVVMKIQGRQEEVTMDELDDVHIRRLIRDISDDEQLDFIAENRQADWATSTNKGRFRVNVGYQQNTLFAVIRTIPSEVIPADKLGTPYELIKASTRTKGLVLVTGPTGSGKSTTLAGLIDYINETRACHILTLEDPIEFSHTRKQAIINQRNLGTDFTSWEAGLKAAMRQAPDVILIGEMRDRETVDAALKAAETGHLVMGTLHTNGAAETINRIVEFYPHDAHSQIQSQLATNIVAVMSQQLIPSAKQGKRVMAYELMLRNNAIVSNIRTLNIPQMIMAISTGSKFGMVQMDKMLADFVNNGDITEEQALERCTDPKGFLELLGRKVEETTRI